MNKITAFISRYNEHLATLFLLCLSVYSGAFYYLNGKNILYADTRSRLDIARKVIDNLHPGFAQFGNVWLPLPQMLMVPFIWSNFLWHSGLAGAFMSGAAFIIGGLYIYKAAKLLTRSILASFLSLCIYALNINIFYLQATAMSEALFLCTLAAAIYYFLLWVKTDDMRSLIAAGLAVSAMTYTRYEGLSVLFASIPMVFILSWLKLRKFSIAEGETILYAVLALTGFIAWSLYLLVIFGDPFYWLHFYAGGKVIVTNQAQIVTYTQQKPFIAAVWEYFTSFVWMMGIIPTVLCVLGMIIMAVKTVKTRTLYFLPLLMPLSIYLFMVMSLQKNTPIVQPDLSLHNIFASDTSSRTGFNIRYGILLLPWVAIMCSYVFSFKYKILNLFLFSFFFIQLISYIYPKYTVIYNTTVGAKNSTKAYPALVLWMNKHYTGGEIMISASSHEDQMFQMGYNYRTYIHEGAGKYWKESIDNPSRYATYVVLDAGHPDDKIAPYFINNPHRLGILDRDYTLVFNDSNENIKIYKIKFKPYFQI